jgi:hypothetical protein
MIVNLIKNLSEYRLGGEICENLNLSLANMTNTWERKRQPSDGFAKVGQFRVYKKDFFAKINSKKHSKSDFERAWESATPLEEYVIPKNMYQNLFNITESRLRYLKDTFPDCFKTVKIRGTTWYRVEPEVVDLLTEGIVSLLSCNDKSEDVPYFEKVICIKGVEWGVY